MGRSDEEPPIRRPFFQKSNLRGILRERFGSQNPFTTRYAPSPVTGYDLEALPNLPFADRRNVLPQPHLRAGPTLGRGRRRHPGAVPFPVRAM
jgi:hypothetical protein